MENEIQQFENTVESTTDQISKERAQRERTIRRIVEGRVLAFKADIQTDDLSEEFANLPTAQKANLLYEKLMARYNALQAMREAKRTSPEAEVEPIDSYLISEIKTLWDDEDTAKLFCSRYAEAGIDAKLYHLSELGTRYQGLNKAISQKEEQFELLSRDLFLRNVTRPDQLSATRGRVGRLAKELIRLRNEREEITELDGLPPIPENTNIAAQISYERLQDYHHQAQEGFVWLDSRVDIHHQTIAALQNGRWPVLVGEAGSGKSEQADAAAKALTGQNPTHLACSERTSERDMISNKEIDSATGGSFDAYGPVMQAATGFEDSRQEHPAFTGRVVRFDESGRLGSQGYAIIKELRQKHAGDLLFGKPVLPGFGSIWTTNPVGPRYPDRNEPDPAMRRELSYISVDYPPQTNHNPEIYEFMLANMMDENGHVAISKDELAPAFQDITLPKPMMIGDYINGQVGAMTTEEIAKFNETDPRIVIGKEEIIEDPTDPGHGTLWRLAFAVRELQNAFESGNAEAIPSDPLRFTTGADGKITISPNGSETLTLATSTITLGEVASWMKGFLDRKLKDNPEFQTDNLTEWIQFKLGNYLKQADEQDADKIRAIFDHFHLFDQAGSSHEEKPLTPREIGYLSPRVPRPLHLREPERKTTADLTILNLLNNPNIPDSVKEYLKANE
ncbi:MAG: AAA family ATPase [Bacillota bacterium]